MSILGRICVVTVNHHEKIRLDAVKHALNDKTFPFSALFHYHGTMALGYFGCCVCRAVVENVDRCRRKFAAEIVDHFSNRDLLIKTGNEDRYFSLLLSHKCLSSELP